jgi:hypothetical protein
MINKTILNYKDLEVKVTDKADEGIIGVLVGAIQGSEGGLRFSLQNIPERIEAYSNNIRFVSLYRKRRITGTVGAIFRVYHQGTLNYPSTYIRYLAFQPVYQSDIHMRTGRKQEARSDQGESNFKQKVLSFLSRPNYLELPGISADSRHIMYAYIESMNERSKNIIHQAGYDYIRSFLTVAFSRFSPVADSRVVKLDSNERWKMELLLNDYYKNHSFFSADYSFYGDNYYVLKEAGEIIAGVNAIPSSYKIYNVPGVWGWVMMKVLPRAPYFRRLFHPEKFRYLVLDSIYCKPGKEELLANLFESVCAIQGYNTGLTWVDDRSDLYDKLRTGVRMGSLNRILNAKPGLVYVRFINIPEKEREIFYNAPAYISGFDFS